MARRRETPGEPAGAAEGSFRVADWTDLPEDPPASFRTRYEHTVGTKGSLEEEWHLRRAVNAARLRSAARRGAQR